MYSLLTGVNFYVDPQLYQMMMIQYQARIPVRALRFATPDPSVHAVGNFNMVDNAVDNVHSCNTSLGEFNFSSDMGERCTDKFRLTDRTVFGVLLWRQCIRGEKRPPSAVLNNFATPCSQMELRDSRNGKMRTPHRYGPLLLQYFFDTCGCTCCRLLGT